MTTEAVKRARDRRGEVWEISGLLFLVVGAPEPYPKFVNCVSHRCLNLVTGSMFSEIETPMHKGTWEDYEFATRLA